ncbi:hypothetical protein OG259_40955 [Streptomyces sp. NBC_00250]|uniref:hypothetical protein n=1 Tax=Streptomyces sp. NBC_00250 TaxID=2903641 RepID=UPI002E2AFCEC|nr:hypothetical protein [Streptomyces sp. NBC_00250]
MPGEIRAAGPLLKELAQEVPARLGDKPTLAIWGMRDMVFRPKSCIPRIRSSFTDLDIVELRQAKHFIQEDAPDRIVEAITERFS